MVRVQSQDTLALLGNEQGDYCLTNSSSAMYSDTNTGIKTEVSRFIPAVEYFCGFGKNDNCVISDFGGKTWTVHDSIHFKSVPIFDERWENLREYNLKKFRERSNNKLLFNKLADLGGKPFSLTVSLRCNEAHFLFCDSEIIDKASCYWFILQGWGQTKSVVRKCDKKKETVPIKNDEYPQESCKEYLKIVYHPADYPVFLNNISWSHITLDKYENKFSIKHVKMGKTYTIMEYEDIHDGFDIKYLLAHTKDKVAYFKLHSYNYFGTQTMGGLVYKNALNVRNDQFCVSVLIHTCQDCFFTVVIKRYVNSQLQLVKKEPLPPSPNKWTRHRVVGNMTDDYFYVYLETYTLSDEPVETTFWAIDNFRTCHAKEYRITPIEQHGTLKSCVLVEDEQTISKEDRIHDVSKPVCNVNEIGQSCISCAVLATDSKSCKQLGICEKINDLDTCYCSPGYLGGDCTKECANYTYGYGCKNKCGYCEDNVACDVADGSCTCNTFFEEPTCHIPKKDQILKDAPAVIEIKPTSCKIWLRNKDYIGKKKPNFYLVQYKKIEKKFWLDYGSGGRIADMDTVEIDRLESSTTYAIRILVSDDSQNIKNLHFFDHVPYAICNTTCKDWTKDNIQITPQEKSVQIVFKLEQENCKEISYKWQLENERGDLSPTKAVANPIQIPGLEPYTLYKIYLIGTGTLETEFRTQDGVPDEVDDLKIVGSTTTSISLFWKKPKNVHGLIAYYNILYKKKRSKHCKQDFSWNPEIKLNTTDESLTLTGLEPFFVYHINVFAVNRRYGSHGSFIYGETLGLDKILEEEGVEKAQISNAITSETGAQFSVYNLPCVNLRGPLTVSVHYKCESSWCLSCSNDSTVTMTNPFSIPGLQPFSTYNYSIKFCRSTDCKAASNGTFTTKATSPQEIKDILVTSKGKNYISLRWIPPYPPTGTLNYYNIITTCVNCNYHRRKDNYIKPTNCTLWPRYQCATLKENIYESYTHSVSIQATNQEVYKYVDVYPTFNVKVMESESNPPAHLEVVIFRNNSLFLTWIHPNQTNGDLKSFEIEINWGQSSLRHVYELMNKTYYQLKYKIWVKKHLPSSKVLRINVTAVNKFRSVPAKTTESTYPLAPSFLNREIEMPSNTETTISISFNLPLIQNNDTTGSYLFILITDPSSMVKDSNFERLEHVLNETLVQSSRMRVTGEISLNTVAQKIFNFTIGDKSETRSSILNNTITNKSLDKGHYFNITLIAVTEFNDKYAHDSLPYISAYTSGDPTMTPRPQEGTETSSAGSGLYALLLLLLLLIPIGIVMFRRRFKLVRSSVSTEKVLDFSCRSATPSNRDTGEGISLDNHLSVQILPKPVMKVKPKLSMRKSTNPPNSSDQIYSKLINIADFEEYVKSAIESGELEKQHALFPRGQTQPWNYGSKKINKPKNRYNNLIAYDHSRVKLDKIPGDENSDYINASYIHGYNIANAYIATQGPKPATLVDFWRMIWQENVRYIVMLANLYEGGKKKVEQYWPNINEELSFENICVQYQSMEMFADFEYRIFHVVREDETRKLEQLHFTSWPDHGVPLYSQSLVPFIRKILKIPLSSMSPVVVHCSAGVGRTGTIILSDISLRMAAKEGAIDMLNNLQKLREQRPNMVDNIEQYKLVHLVVLESLMGLRSNIPCNDNMENVVERLIREGDYKVQLNYLKETEWQDQAMKSVFHSSEEFIDYPVKNRFQQIVPENQARIFLTRYPQDDESSSYINAVYVDGFRCPGRFIVTQQPMPNTLGDFWRLIVERQSSVIISLNEVNSRNKMSCKFWPTSEEPELHPVDFITVTFGKAITLEYYDIYSVNIWITNSEEDKRDVQIISFKRWQSDAELPRSCEEFLSFWEEADAISRRSTDVIVTCLDGAKACGVYVALSFVIEKIKLEQECDVCLAVRNVRHNRRQFISLEKQFVFLYEAAVKYIVGFQSYANFQNQ